MGAPEEELAIEVAYVDSVHVYYMDVLETGQCEIGQNLATEAACADHKNLALVPQEVFDLDV